MKVFYYSRINPLKRMLEVESDELRIGRGAGNGLSLESPFIAEDAAVLQKVNGQWEFIVLSLNAVYLGDKPLYRGDRWLVTSEQSIRMEPFTLEFDVPVDEDDTVRKLRELDLAAQTLVGEIHTAVVNRMRTEFKPNENGEIEMSVDELKRWEDEIERVAHEMEIQRPSHADCVDHLAGLAVRDHLVHQLSSNRGPEKEFKVNGIVVRRNTWSRLISSNANRENELDNTCRHFAIQLSLAALPDLSEQLSHVEKECLNVWRPLAHKYHFDFKLYLTLRHIKKQVKDLIFGYGPLEDLLALPTITEIMVVNSERIYVEKRGRIENSGRRFLTNAVTESIIARIVEQVGRTIDRSKPLVDARLRDGSRVNAVIDPIAFSGPCLTIRKFPSRKLMIDDLVQLGALTQSVAEFLRAAVLTKQNILISGGTGTGKTTLLNCLSDFIPDHERIVTIEDTVELRLNKDHVVQMETKESNLEGKGAYTIRDLVKNALRMRPDRVVVGECRGAEALDMLQAMNTGHDGSLTTIHANSAEEVVLRLEVMVQMASDLPVLSIHSQIGSAVNLVVQLRRVRDGRRLVVQVSEIVGLHPVTGRVEMRDLFRMDDAAEDYRLLPTGHLPSFMWTLIEQKLIDLDRFYH